MIEAALALSLVCLVAGLMLVPLSQRNARTQQRIDAIYAGTLTVEVSAEDRLKGWMRPLGFVGRLVLGSGLLSRKTIGDLEKTMAAAGYRSAPAVSFFVGSKLALLVGLPLFMLTFTNVTGFAPVKPHPAGRHFGGRGPARAGLHRSRGAQAISQGCRERIACCAGPSDHLRGSRARAGGWLRASRARVRGGHPPDSQRAADYRERNEGTVRSATGAPQHGHSNRPRIDVSARRNAGAEPKNTGRLSARHCESSPLRCVK